MRLIRLALSLRREIIMSSRHLARLLRLFFWAGLVLVTVSAGAQSPAWSSQIVFEEESQVWRFMPDESSAVERRIAVRVLSMEGAQGMSSVPLSFQEGWQTLTLLDAYTEKPDQRQVPLDRSSIQKQIGALGGSTGITWPEYRAWQLKFTDVQVGDRLVLRYRITQLKPFLPGWQSYGWFANRNWTTEKLTIEVHAPKTLKLAVESSGVEASRRDEDGSEVRVFTGRVSAGPTDTDARNLLTTLPRVIVSTIGSADEMGRLFARGMEARMRPTPALREIAEQQTKGLTAPADKARALYDWVRQQVRYNATYLGAGGWVPNDVAVILEKRDGDCKDHVLLLMSLLNAVGLEGVPALINTAGEHVANTIPIAFNHVLVYVPALDQYLDPVASQIPYGELPYADYDKPVILSRSAQSEAARTPALKASDNRIATMAELEIDADGALRGVLRVQSTGYAALQLQARLAEIAPGTESSAVRDMLQRAKLTGTGTLRHAPLDRERASQDFELEVRVPHYLSPPEAGALSPNPAIPGFGVYLLQNIADFGAENRKFAMPCTPLEVHEKFQLKFAPEYAVKRTPADFAIEADGIRMTAHYSFAEQRLTGDRTFVNTHPSMVCDVAQYAQRKATMRAINKHLQQRLLYGQ